MKSCVLCGCTVNVIEHHISYSPEIKVDLCRKCHAKEHPKRDRIPNIIMMPQIGKSFHMPVIIRRTIKSNQICYIVGGKIALLFNENSSFSEIISNLRDLLKNIDKVNGEKIVSMPERINIATQQTQTIDNLLVGSITEVN